jgi:hypothetical protein
MSDDESILTPTERLAASALRAALHDESADQPLRMDVVGWIEGAPRKRPSLAWVPVGLAAVLALVLVVGLVAWPRAGGSLPGNAGESPSAGPSLPGTPGHFDDGQESFDYPTDWPTIAAGFSSGGVEYVLAVLGDGTWREGCVYGENSISCGADTFDVPPGGILVKVYRWYGGPMVPCRGDTQANATFGDLAVRKTVDGTATTWEIRVPGNEFGQPNNIFVEVHTSDPSQLARAEALVASFRWLDSSGSVNCSPAPPTGGPGPS